MASKKQTGWHLGGKDKRCFAESGKCPFGGESGRENHFPPTPEGLRQLEERIGEIVEAEKQQDIAECEKEQFQLSGTVKYVILEQNWYNRHITGPTSPLLKQWLPNAPELVNARTDMASPQRKLARKMFETVSEDAVSTMLKISDTKAKLKTAQTTNDVELIKAFAFDNDIYVRRSICENPNTPRELIDYLIETEGLSILAWPLARNPQPQMDLIHKLANSKKPDCMLAVIDCRLITPEMLASLGARGNKQVKWSVARHPKTSAKTLLSMTKYLDGDVEIALSRNPNTPADALDIIVNNNETQDDLVDNVLAHKNASAATLTKIFQYPFKRPGRRQKVFELLRNNPNTPMKILLKIAEIESEENDNVEDDE